MNTPEDLKKQKEEHRRRRRLSAIFHGKLSRALESRLRNGPRTMAHMDAVYNHLALYK